MKPSAFDELLKVIKHDAVHSEGDQLGCMRFDVLSDNEDPLKFYFYEFYKDEAARLVHRKMPHFAEWAKSMEYGLDRDIVRHTTTNFHPDRCRVAVGSYILQGQRMLPPNV